VYTQRVFGVLKEGSPIGISPVFGMRKLEAISYHQQCLHGDGFNYFNALRECDRLTDGQMNRHVSTAYTRKITLFLAAVNE